MLSVTPDAMLSCVLTEKTLQVAKGLFVRVEKTVPLDKITDMGLVQGPIMRHFGLETLSVETAGQSSQGSLLKLTGIVETRRFRDTVLRQRDEAVASLAREGRPTDDGSHRPPHSPGSPGATSGGPTFRAPSAPGRRAPAAGRSSAARRRRSRRR